MFTTSTPVGAAAFFDREAELEDLRVSVDRLRRGAPSWIALLGKRKIGKSSLLLELARRVTAEDLAVVVLDSFEFSPLGRDVLVRYALRAVDVLLGRRVGVSLEARARRPADFRAALVPVLETLPEDVARLVLELSELAPGPAVDRLCLELPEHLASALGLRVIVAWDEFQAIASLRGRRGTEELLPLMRSVWQRHQRVGYVVSGSERSVLREMLIESHAPFFQHFAIRELGDLPEEDAVRLLTEGAPPDRPISDSLARRVVEVVGGHPFYLQLVGDELTRLSPPYDEGALKQTIQSVLFSRAGRLALFFENEYRRLVGNATTLAAALEAVATRPGTLSELASAIHAPTSATSRYLSRLGDAVERNDGQWRIADPVFALWVRWRCPGGTAVPMSLLGDDGERQAARHLAELGFDLVYQSRASRGAFDLLAIRGAWQVGLQVKRRALPLRFRLAEWQRMQADAARLGWRWAVVAVSPGDDSVAVLDPEGARIGREVRIDRGAAIDNLLAWVEHP